MDKNLLRKKWIALRNKFSGQIGKKPDINAFLFLIGIQECGLINDAYTKEEKQDLMHVAISLFLCKEGYYELEGKDKDGWPHYHILNKPPVKTIKKQEEWLKTHIVLYFDVL